MSVEIITMIIELLEDFLVVETRADKEKAL